MSGAPTLNAGFIPLIDAAPLLVAERLGLAAAEGVTLNLSRETSWATIRDRLSVNHLDVAHALAPLPLAANLGLGPMDARMIVPICFGTGGNTVTVATHVAEAIRQAEGASAPAAMSARTSAPFDPSAAVAGLKRLVRERDAAGLRKLVFGIVHPHSAHRYQLAYWLASGGIVPGRDISLLVLPPALLPSALEAGRIDGFCAGEPWGSTAVASSAGTILTTNAHIWRGSPEKVLAVNAEWAEPNRDALLRLVRAIYRACLWCDDAENHGALADLLAGDDAVGTPRALIANSLARTLPAAGDTKVAVDGFLQFAGGAVSFPWVSHAFWFATQMDRWHETTLSASVSKRVWQTWRPDLYREALADLDVDVPAANAKVEGAIAEDLAVGSTSGRLKLGPDGFFDRRVFDIDRIEDYIADLKAADANA